jgi:hypothetical protein
VSCTGAVRWKPSVLSLMEASMTFLLPAEHLDGSDADQRQLRSLLSRLRNGPQPAPLPHITCRALPDVLASGLADRSLFDAGYELLSQRCTALGMTVLLPLSRVWAGVSSSAPPGDPACFGGFHHPGQGYRHLQMTATITTYGQLTQAVSATPQSVALDLVRSYAHDCLHYGTCRRYRLTPDGQVARVQYGINFRSLDGGTYSAPDAPDATATRNLGIVMEGATDTEATTIARQAAATAGITGMAGPACVARYAFEDTTGTLTATAIKDASAAGHPYLRALAGFNSAVTGRYRALVRQLADDPGQLHHHFVASMISGDLAELEQWLDARHGPGCFASTFRAPAGNPAAGPRKPAVRKNAVSPAR